MSKSTRTKKSAIRRTLIFASALVLLCIIGVAIVRAEIFSGVGTFFEIDKIPIEEVSIISNAQSVVKCSDEVEISSVLYPEKSRLTVIEEKYEIIDGKNYARIIGNTLIIGENAPIGTRIEVVSVIDDVKSKNSLVFTVGETFVEEIVITNEQSSITLGGALKIETAVFPENATNKAVTYSISSDTPSMRISYSGMLSFTDEQSTAQSVTVRATSIANPAVFAEKTFTIHAPVTEVVPTSPDLMEVHQCSAYSFNVEETHLNEIFGMRAVDYKVDVDESIATIDVNGLLYVQSTAPIGTSILVSIDSKDGLHYEKKLVVAPVYATEFSPVILTEPNKISYGKGYYLPETVIEVDVVSFMPVNVTECNKVFAIRIDDESLAYVEGHKVIIRKAEEITKKDPKLTITVYSEPNNLEQSFEIDLFIPIKQISAETTVENFEKQSLYENTTYNIEDILNYKCDPANGTVHKFNYRLEGVDESIAVIRDNQLIIKDNLPKGEITVRLYVEINDVVISNVVEFNVYKPAHSLTLTATLNGKEINISNLPKSYENKADTVVFAVETNAEASENAPSFEFIKGEEYIDGAIKYIETKGNISYWQITLKKNLGEVKDWGKIIKLQAFQDTVSTKIVTLEIFIPNEKFQMVDIPLNRGEINALVTDKTPNATLTLWELELTQEAVSLGVTKDNDNPYAIFVPKALSAGTPINLRYRLKGAEEYGQEAEWKEITLSVAAIKNTDSICKYEGEGIDENKFNVVYGYDSVGGSDNKSYIISSTHKQLFVGKHADVILKYHSDFISAYGMKIKNVEVTGPATVVILDDNTFRVKMNADAKADSCVSLVITVSDNKCEYEFDGGVLYAYKEAYGTLEFATMTSNKANPLDLIVKSKFDVSDFSGGAGALKFNLLSSDSRDVIAIENGRIVVKSFKASKEQTIQCLYEGTYNGIKLPAIEKTAKLSIRTVSLDKDGGSGGRDYIVAISGLDTGKVKLEGDLQPTKTGFNFNGVGDYIDANGVITKDLSSCTSLKVKWTAIKFKVIVKKACNENCTGDISSGTYEYTDVIELSAPEWDKHESPSWSVKVTDGKVKASDIFDNGNDVTITCNYNHKSCITGDTLITLADGTQKAVKDLTGDEMLLVWNMFTGDFDVAPILFTEYHGIDEYLVTRLLFEDGSYVDIIEDHGFFDFDLNKYVYITNENAEEYIGHSFNKLVIGEGGEMSYTSVKLVGITRENRVTGSYSPVSYGHICYYVNGILSVPSETEGFVNFFEVDSGTMKYDEEAMKADIEKYGLFSYEKDYSHLIPKEIFDAFNGEYVKISICKGVITEKELETLIREYVKNIEWEDNVQ